jgi:SM-20-related protein
MTASSATGTKLLNLRKLEQASLQNEPFEYVLVSEFLDESSSSQILTDFPSINRNGSFPLSTLTYGPQFQDLIDELLGPEFEKCVSEKFGMELSQYPTMITVRGQCNGTADGHIHTDSREKIITVLLYLNPEWNSGGGRLRLLRSKNLEDMAAEVPPTFGSLLIFKRCDWSWHGHKPFEGKRLSLQMNWVASDRYGKREQFRHKVSSFFKRIFGRSSYEG